MRRSLRSRPQYPTDDRPVSERNKKMKIAVTFENGNAFGHFGHTEQFKLYDIENGKIIKEEIVYTNGSGHGALAGFLGALNVDAPICGNIGAGAQNALKDAGILYYPGVTGSADEAVKAFAEGKLVYDPDAKCDHHEHHDGECGGKDHASRNCGGN